MDPSPTEPTDVTGIQINLFDRTHAKSKSYKVSPTATSFTLPAGALTNGDTYIWNLRFVEGTRTGEPGTYLYFQAPPIPPLPTPIITSPGDATSPGPVLTTNKPTFQWTAVTGVSNITGYQLNLYNITTAKSATYKISSTATSFTLPGDGLITGDAYVWNLRVLAGTRTGPVSNYLYFQAPSAPTIPAPVIISPGSTTSPGPVLTTATPTFQWTGITGVTGMTGYQLNLYDSTAAKSTSYKISPTATSFTLPAGVLTAGDNYVWNLRLVLGSKTGPESAYFYFQAPPAATLQELPAPIITSPGNATSPGPVLTTSTPNFEWTPVTGVTGMTGYQLNLFDSTASVSTSYQISSTANHFALPAGVLTAGDAYVWNLRIVVGDHSGPPSAYFYFQAPPVSTTIKPVPVLVSPGGTTTPGPVLTTTTPTFQWTAVSGVTGVTGYQISLYDTTATTNTSYQVSADATSFTLPAGVLVAGDHYTWNVHLLLGTTVGAKSGYLYFQAPPAATPTIPAPVITSPGTTATPGPVLTTNTPTFQWNAVTGVPGMTGYQLNLYDSTAAKSTSYQISPTAISFTLPTGVLTAGDHYVWNLRLVLGTTTGPESAYFYFQAPPAATPTIPAPVISSPGTTPAPGSTITTFTPTFQWTPITGVSGITGYQLNLYDSTTAKLTTYQISADASSFTLPAGILAAGNDYVWNLRLVLGTKTGPESNYLDFQAPAASV